MERTAIFPGSFDPFTRGHAALVDEALNLIDRVIIGIGNNTSKQGLLTVENRKRLIDDIYRGDERVVNALLAQLLLYAARAEFFACEKLVCKAAGVVLVI